jgi:hypothetical protein
VEKGVAVFQILQILAVIFVAVALTTSLAHALEYPGKLRLTKEQYLAVQPTYYPGFTFAGGSEPLSIITLLVLTFMTSAAIPFWLTLGALVALVASHAVYWLFTHPVNNFWLEGFELKGAGKAFFGADPLRRAAGSTGAKPDWTVLRDRWETSHIIRAVLTAVGFVMLVTAVAI